jgi:sigma-B regulation protein RsbU (phosphoserine phosphatase)
MPELIVRSGASAGSRFPLSREAEVGRSAQASVPLKDPSVSRRHAVLAPGPDGAWSVSDLGSQNGTRVNGKAVAGPVPLRDGDVLTLGSVSCEFHAGEPASTPSVEASRVLLVNDVAHSVLAAKSAVGGSPLSRATDESVDAWSRRLQLVYDVGLALGGTLEEDAMLAKVLEKVFEVFPKADRGFVMVYDAATDALTSKAAQTRKGDGSTIAMSTTIVWDAIRNRRAILSVDAMHDGRFVEGVSVQLLGIRSVVCVPMLAGSDVFGVVTLYTADARLQFDKDDMAVLLAIAGQAALALSNIRLHRRVVAEEAILHDLALARKVQERFLPQSRPEVPGWDFRAHYAPALEIGGDYYGFLPLDEGRVGVAIGDVSGKGISAALFMARLGSEMRLHAVNRTDPSEILARVNDVLAAESEDGMFVTASLLVLDTATGRVDFANAGHLLPLVRRAGGDVERVAAPPNLPLALAPGVAFPGVSFALSPGDAVVLYTDGVSEAPQGSELFGEPRLLAAVRDAGPAAEDILTDVLASVMAHLKGAAPADDVTLVCVSRGDGGTPDRAGTRRVAPVG